MAISIEIRPYITTVDISTTVTTIEANLAVPSTSSGSVTITPTGTITATSLQGALEQLAAQDFRSATAPTGTNLEVGDTWYDIANDQFYVYRDVGLNNFQWVPIIVGSAGATSDELDAGAF